MIRYRPNLRKVLDAILWLAKERPGMDMYRILKVLFLADKAHLNKYGRPIAGEQYVAMKYGPVAETAYQMLRRQRGPLKRLHLTEYPFAIESDDDGRPVRVFAARDPDLTSFSESDINELAQALDKYGKMNFNALKALTHSHPAYKRAWAARGDSNVAPMDWKDLLDEDKADPEVLEELEYVSRFLR